MSEEISNDEFIIRRIPPSRPEIQLDYVTMKDGDRKRATSMALSLRTGENGLSCSRLTKTSPKQLLAQVGVSTSDGWTVAIWKISELPIGLKVVITPSTPPDLDPGHCEIRPIDTYTRKIQSNLAKASTILSVEDIESLKPGDIPTWPSEKT